MSAEHVSVVELAHYLERTAGLAFDESRRPGLTAVLKERLAGSGLASEREYLALLTSVDGADERQFSEK